MSRSLTLDLPADQAEALDSVADRLRISPAATAAVLIGEALVHERFPWVEFRDSVVGRQAYVVGSGLAVWEVVMVAEGYALDPARTAEHLDWARPRVECVLAYAREFPGAIQAALEENRSMTEEKLRALLPNAKWA